MDVALRALLELRPDGVQLTPGNQPTHQFERLLDGVTTRTHHGFEPRVWKRTVWNDDGSCAVSSDSVHPPLASHPSFATWRPSPAMPVIETMYPGSALGTGDELEAAMREGLSLAVDVSHVFIQRTAGVIADSTWRRLQDYPHIAEVHVSRNEGKQDSHLPLMPDTFGLAWAKARLRAGTAVILESYFHRLSPETRRQQVALFDEDRS
jgi:hypothetical protein